MVGDRKGTTETGIVKGLALLFDCQITESFPQSMHLEQGIK